MCRNHMHTAGIFLVYPNRCLRWMAGCFEDDIDCMMTFLSLFSICCRDNYQGWYSFLFHPVFFLNRICCPAGKSFFWHIQNHSNRFPGIQANCLVEFFLPWTSHRKQSPDTGYCRQAKTISFWDNHNMPVWIWMKKFFRYHTCFLQAFGRKRLLYKLPPLISKSYGSRSFILNG